MNILRRETFPRYKRDNIESFLLVSERTCGSEKLAVTLVEMKPDGFQHLHAHEQEQMYYILEGHGIMQVGEEESEVSTGDCIFFSSHTKHGLRNTGGSVLKYLSAASPSFKNEDSERFWPLPSLSEV